MTELENLFREASRGVTQHRTMRFSAPRRMSEELPDGRYYTLPWSKPGVLSYRAIGGWFEKGKHDFADRAAAVAAGVLKEDAE